MKSRDGTALLLILLAALWRHVGALRAPFFADDYLFLDQAKGSLLHVLGSPDPIGNFMRPVGRQLWFWVMLRLAHGSPVVFHAANLALFLGALVLLFHLARRVAGSLAAVVASSLVALHYAADVPILWASGSQDLLALVGALATLSLNLAGRRAWACLALALALLSKETVCLVPLIAVVADAGDGRYRAAIRRAMPLFAVTAMWLAAWWVRAMARPVAHGVLEPSVPAVPAALLHFLQVAVGAEYRAGSLGRIPWAMALGPIAAVLAAVWWWRERASTPAATPAARESARGNKASASAPAIAPSPSPSPSHAMRLGLAWGLLGALPVAAVAPIWSAYFYLFAVCGFALSGGAWLARRPTAVCVALVAVLVLASESARSLDEFATGRGMWAAESHVNRHYVERAMSSVQRHLAELMRARPTLPPRSTVFFANLPQSTGLQAADGPLVRWAYGDTTLRSYYLTQFTYAKATRGPLFFFAVVHDTLQDRSDDPGLLRTFAYSMTLVRKPEPAIEALTLQLERHPADRDSRYWLAWNQWAVGRADSAVAQLRRCGIGIAPGPTAELADVEIAIARRDTMAAESLLVIALATHGLDVEVHSRLAALCLSRPAQRAFGVIEAFAVTVLDPERADGWRKFAVGQVAEEQFGAALESLERYFRLGGAEATQDAEAQQVLATLRRIVPGGDLSREGIRN